MSSANLLHPARGPMSFLEMPRPPTGIISNKTTIIPISSNAATTLFPTPPSTSASLVKPKVAAKAPPPPLKAPPPPAKAPAAPATSLSSNQARDRLSRSQVKFILNRKEATAFDGTVQPHYHTVFSEGDVLKTEWLEAGELPIKMLHQFESKLNEEEEQEEADIQVAKKPRTTRSRGPPTPIPDLPFSDDVDEDEDDEGEDEDEDDDSEDEDDKDFIAPEDEDDE